MKLSVLTFVVCLIVVPAQAKYSGGTGEPNDPYQIATAADLIALGETPADYDKHFILTTDIDLDPNLPGRKVFDRAVIAPDMDTGTWEFQGTPFTGVFDGNDHMISHLTIRGGGCLGLFGQLKPGTEVKNLAVVDVNIDGSDDVGGLVGDNPYGASVTHCYSSGTVGGNSGVGGLLGSRNTGNVTRCYSTCTVSGTGWYVGGLVAANSGRITTSYSTGAVSGRQCVGGLVGSNGGSSSLTHCYSTGRVTGAGGDVGGLAGSNGGTVSHCYSSGTVDGNSEVGGLLGSNYGEVLHSVWNAETSGLSGSAGAVGLSTTEMMDPYMLGLNGFANDPNWVLDAGRDYPRLAWEGTPGDIIPEPNIDWLEGQGTAEDPYRIDTSDQLILVGRASVLHDRHFVLGEDIDLDPSLPAGQVFGQAVIPTFSGIFDGRGHEISHLTIMGGGYLGLFGQLGSTANVSNLALEAVDVNGTGGYVGGVVGYNFGSVATSYSTGAVSGTRYVGGLVGSNGFNQGGQVIDCYSSGSVSGGSYVGGLVGWNYTGTIATSYSIGAVSGTGDCVGGLVGCNEGGTVTECYSTGSVSGGRIVGGLAGNNGGDVSNCYSTGAVSGNDAVGGLVGWNWGIVTECYSAGVVSATSYGYGGLVGWNARGSREAGHSVVTNSFWDIQTSDQATSYGGTGKTTAEMQTAKTFLDAGWDFVGETKNGPNDVWKIVEGQTYPLLSWQKYSGGRGEPNDPYQIATAADLIALGETPEDYDKNFVLTADIDLDPKLPGHKVFDRAVIAPRWFWPTSFTGVFDGNGHVIRHLTATGKNDLGLFGYLESGAEIRNLGVVDVNIVGSGDYVAGLVAFNGRGCVAHCYSTGAVSGSFTVGGLVGSNISTVTCSYSTGVVSGSSLVGGLLGSNSGAVTYCYSSGAVTGTRSGVGGLVGSNSGRLSQCYSTSPVRGGGRAGGLVGENLWGVVTGCYSTGAVSGEYALGGLVGSDMWGPGLRSTPPFHTGIVTDSFWETQTSGQTVSDGGTGKTTAEMQTASTFLDAGWDFVGETANGTEDIWWIDEGKDYPRLWWELNEEAEPNP